MKNKIELLIWNIVYWSIFILNILGQLKIDEQIMMLFAFIYLGVVLVLSRR